MKISKLQQHLVDALNGCEELMQGGCKAFAEDTRTVYDEAEAFAAGGGVALVVVTPRLARIGGNTEDGIPVEGDVLIRAVERVPLAAAESTIRALDAAAIVAEVLDGEDFEFKSLDQTSDMRRETVTATATFACAFILN